MTNNAADDEIRAFVEAWAGAVRLKDIDGALANHADDIVMFDAPVPLQSKGIEEYKETWERFFEHVPGGPGSFDVTELRIVSSESVAYCHAIVNIFGSKVRLTMGLRKERANWLITHEHHSYPIEPDPESKMNAFRHG
jgi:ketosteroid isomerase-like protein